MRTLSSDTSVKAEQVHIELIRKASIYRRLEMVNSLIKTTRRRLAPFYWLSQLTATHDSQSLTQQN